MEPMEPSREIEKGSSYRELRTNDRKYRALGEVMQELLMHLSIETPTPPPPRGSMGH